MVQLTATQEGDQRITGLQSTESGRCLGTLSSSISIAGNQQCMKPGSRFLTWAKGLCSVFSFVSADRVCRCACQVFPQPTKSYVLHAFIRTQAKGSLRFQGSDKWLDHPHESIAASTASGPNFNSLHNRRGKDFLKRFDSSKGE